jgi:2-C-methyl-D-erythritol 4-phosphate cytidylyltransferase/2-C-methyl-D-erythritol 2,4-cyclodiphosphate synthase
VTGLAAVMVAAGQSRRMGEDKLWLDLHGRPVWRWSLDTLLATPMLERLALVVASGSEKRYRSLVPSAAMDRCLLVPGGETRRDSVLAGLAALTDAGCGDQCLVLVHDAARPAVTPALIGRVVDAAGSSGGVVPGLPVSDTLMRTRGQHVERDQLVAVQTPQLGRLGDLRSALMRGDFTDEGSALAVAGVEVRIVPGDPANRKLTEPADLDVLRATLRDRAAPVQATSTGLRAGIGFDAHRLAEGVPLRLGGVAWPDEPRGLAGHSDGDAALHAIVDALLGAAGLGDIGALFPPDERWSGADSGDLLRLAVERLSSAGWRPAQVDLVIVAASPAIAPRRDEIAATIAGLLGVDVAAVGVKGTTSDGLGLPGGEGIAAYAVASIEPA